jgi:UDP-N-acetylmuramate dehydrogenase
MEVIENYSLKSLNTFGIDASARHFAVFKDTEQLDELIERAAGSRKLILGGGSNILLTNNFDGYVLKNDVMGMNIVKEDHLHAYVKTGAGENWHRFVQYCLERELAGVENLSLIPGNVGASPMQNIGAYGVEVKDVFYDLEAYHIAKRKVMTFSATDCEFGYRESVFKNRYKNEFIILNVTFRLNKVPQFNTSYGAIEEELSKMNEPVSIHAISRAVINIRTSKLPDPKVIGNAGSFFKNPTVSAAKFEELKSAYPSLPGYPQESGMVKLAAGWLIEQCGWKGYRKGDAGCHAKQALVLVNYGHASGSDIFSLSEQIQDSVVKKFGVVLEREVNVV